MFIMYNQRNTLSLKLLQISIVPFLDRRSRTKPTPLNVVWTDPMTFPSSLLSSRFEHLLQTFVLTYLFSLNVFKILNIVYSSFNWSEIIHTMWLPESVIKSMNEQRSDSWMKCHPHLPPCERVTFTPLHSTLSASTHPTLHLKLQL